jgi:hypothetical protein
MNDEDGPSYVHWVEGLCIVVVGLVCFSLAKTTGLNIDNVFASLGVLAMAIVLGIFLASALRRPVELRNSHHRALLGSRSIRVRAVVGYCLGAAFAGIAIEAARGGKFSIVSALLMTIGIAVVGLFFDVVLRRQATE